MLCSRLLRIFASEVSAGNPAIYKCASFDAKPDLKMNILTLLQAAPGAAQQPAGGGWSMWIMLILIFVVMWLFMIRPQRKQQKELQKFREGLQKGDKIVTIGGIYGTVAEVKEKTLIIEVDSNVKIKVDKNSVVKDFSAAQQQ